MLKGHPSYDQGLFLMHLHRGKEYFDQNDLLKAREELESARQMRPQDEKVLNILGMTYFKLDMLPEAEEMYDALATKNPDIYTLQSNLGLIQLKLDKLDAAGKSLGRALELQPTNPKAHFYLGLLAEKKQDWQEALKHFEYARAEKMISKMRGRIEEERQQREMLLPFQVLDVIAVTESQAQQLIPETSSEEIEATGEEEPFELPPVEDVPEESVFDMPEEESAASSEVTSTVKISDVQLQEAIEQAREEMIRPDVLQFPTPAMSEEDEELFEAATPEVVDEPVEEPQSAVDESEKKPWEKTEPKLMLEEIVDTEQLISSDSDPLEPVAEEPLVEESTTQEEEGFVQTEEAQEDTAPAAQTNGSFFLMEEMAADISTFLAQTRMQDEAPASAESIFDEPPQMMIFNVEEAIPEKSTADDLFESRIPSPEEVENQTQDIGAEALFEKEPSAIPVEDLPGVIEEVEDLPEPFDEPEDAESEEIPISETGTDSSPVEDQMITQAISFIQDVEQKEEARTTSPEVSADEKVEEVASVSPEPAFLPANLDQLSRERFYVQPVIGADRFLLIDPHLLQIVLSEKLFCRSGTISSYTGNLQFAPWESKQSELFPLLEIRGNGIAFFADRRKEIFILSLNQESIHAEVNHLLVAQSALTLEPQMLNDNPPARSLPIVNISGRGTIALTCQTRPLTLKVQEHLPVHIPSEALIAWSGNMKVEVIQDAGLRKVLMASPEEGGFLRFTGSGGVVVEQGSLSGDRRIKK